MALFHVFNTVDNRATGVPMAGVQVRAKFDDTDIIAPIYANQAGVAFDPANTCVTDADGMFSFYIDAGEYTLEFLVGSVVIKSVPDFRPAEVGPSGPANSSYATTAELESADTANVSAILAEAGKAGTFTTRDYVDFTAQVTADSGKVNYIRSVFNPTKVWVRTSILSDAASQTGASSGVTVDAELAAKAALTGVGRTATDLGTFTGSSIPDNQAIKGALQALETAVETTTGDAAIKANASALGVSTSATNMGTFTGTTIPDNQTAKQAMQALESEVDKTYKAPAIDFLWWAGGDIASKAQISSEVDMVADAAKPLFGHVHRWNTSVGVGVIPYQVGRAETMYGNPGGGNFYTWNPISHVDAGWTGDAFTTIEVNSNNFSGINFGDSAAAGDVSNSGLPWAVPFNVVCIGDARFTSGFALSAPAAAGQIYNRGYVVAGDCVRLHDYEAATNAPVALKVSGTRSGACLDLSTAIGTNGLFLNNNMSILSKNSVGGIAIVLRQDSSDNLIWGEGSAQIVAAKPLNPSTANTFALGTMASRWASSAISDLHLAPLTSVSPTENGELVIEATSNTSLTLKLRGSDGVTRSVSLTLA